MFSCISVNTAVEPNSPTPIIRLVEKQPDFFQRMKNLLSGKQNLPIIVKENVFCNSTNIYKKLKHRTLITEMRGMSKWSGLLSKKAHISREFQFRNSADVLKFVNSIFTISENMNHYPKVTIMKNKVLIILRTSEVNGISSVDIEMAKLIDGVA